jgi:hypothetical protein
LRRPGDWPSGWIFDVISGRVKTAVDWWYNHLLDPVLVLLHLRSYQSLRKLRPARASARAGLLHALSPSMVCLATRLTRNDP